MATPHNQATKGEIAKTVLMPGDPLRAKFLAETYLENVKQFNTVRNMFGYTGTYKGKEVSIMNQKQLICSSNIHVIQVYRSVKCGDDPEDQKRPLDLFAISLKIFALFRIHIFWEQDRRTDLSLKFQKIISI